VKKLSDMMEFLRESFAVVIHNQQEDTKKMPMVQAKLQTHDEQFQRVEAKLEALSSHPDRSTNTIGTVARNQYAALELKIEAEAKRLSSRFASASASSSSSASAPPSFGTTSTLGNVAVRGGIGENTPEEEALSIAKEFL